MTNRRIPQAYRRLQAVYAEALAESSVEVNPEEQPESQESKHTSSVLCDLIQATLHRDEDLRDAVVDTRYNEANNSLLLILNPALNKRRLLHLASVLQSLSQIDAMSYSSRPDAKGSPIQLVKIRGTADDVNQAEMDRLNY